MKLIQDKLKERFDPDDLVGLLNSPLRPRMIELLNSETIPDAIEVLNKINKEIEKTDTYGENIKDGFYHMPEELNELAAREAPQSGNVPKPTPQKQPGAREGEKNTYRCTNCNMVGHFSAICTRPPRIPRPGERRQ